MKVAVISDIHSNLEALEAVLRDIAKQGVDEIVCLGDVVGYGADPGPCVDRIRALRCPVLLGNHDEGAGSPASLEGYSALALAGIAYSRTHLTREQKRWLASRPRTLKSRGTHFVHSSLHEPREWHYVTDELAAEFNFLVQKLPVCFHGHTHVPCIWERETDGLRLETCPRQRRLRAESRYLINCGSVGQPRDRNPRASYALWSPVEQQVVFRRVPYDIDTAQAKIRAAGLPEQLARRLEQGK